jgi:ribosomal protein L11 methyltransferase
MSEGTPAAPAGSQASYQVTLVADVAAAEAISSRLEEAVEPQALAVSLFDRGNGRFEISALYAEPPRQDALIALIGAEAGSLGALRAEPLAPRDWVTLSQGKRGSVHAGRFLIHGSHDRGRVPKLRLSLEIDAGQAFGTAHHASTRGCLLALDDLLKRERPRVILDIGTGTGILAIAAAAALQCRVLASDEDEVAVGIAADNARKNRAGTLVSVVTATGFAHPRLRRIEADLLLANLLERALSSLAPELARRVTGGGTAILSGLTQTQARGIEARTRAFGFILEKRVILDGWTTLVTRRRKGRAVGD